MHFTICYMVYVRQQLASDPFYDGSPTAANSPPASAELRR